ncbi:hypothetical protein HYV86_00950 [Candidatus Woesearchaeota archaeon]|nr:hypothetical protein [Candidatus Woesearchaeota archaeon]
MTYTLHNPITGDGLPGSNSDLQFGNQLYIISIQPRYNGSAVMGSGYNPLALPSNALSNVPTAPSYGRIGATPLNHPLTRMNGLSLDSLIPTDPAELPFSQGSRQGLSSSKNYVLPVALMFLYLNNSGNKPQNHSKH